jgi:N-formylglutamate amidohydrolase
MCLRGWDEMQVLFGASEDDGATPPCATAEPKLLASPLVFSSPHSGRCYPKAFLAASRLDLQALRSSEDVAVDDLFVAAPAHGAPLLRANFPRAFLDVNREPNELDPKLFDQPPPASSNLRSLRVASGLGTIARVVAEGQAIYRERIPLAEGLERIEKYYRPYHAALEALLDRTAQKFGGAILIDCHSMPSRMPTGDSRRPYEPVAADIVIGDRHGSSCDPAIAHRVHTLLSGMGYRVIRNKPYAGGFITENYAARPRNRHVLQIEINRALYLDEKTLQPGPGYARLKEDITQLIAEITPGRELPGATWRQAAE